MAQVPFALSVHHFISSVGADVGFASLIGLALLVLLFFSQARETSTLRSRADEAGLRIQELESEVAELAEQLAALPAEISVRAASPRAAAAFGAAQPGAPVAAGVGASTLPPAAPAGVAAPALAAATRLIPDPVHPLPEYTPGASAGNGNGSPSRPVVAASAATMQRPVQAPPAGTARSAAPTPRVGGGAGGRPGRGPGAGQGRPPGAGQPRPGTPSRPPGAPLRPPSRRSKGRMVLGGVIAAVALAAIAVGVIVLTGGSKHSPTSAGKSSTNATLASHRSTSATAVQPATVTVSVLNGTDMSGLAGDVSKRLQTVGYLKGSVTNASDQTHVSTIVAYVAPTDRRDALAVASALKLKKSSVQLVDPTTKATACPPAQACTSAVVVTVGTDLAQP
jgi:LytR cell envelope-related transcriptional attenuator